MTLGHVAVRKNNLTGRKLDENRPIIDRMV
ncbi:MAG: hypothetical protein QOJ04_5128 [Caballeronia sp.]|jgi:hypothetical protein|nr:hypothetical protein [Caballeronia sp.]